MWVIDLATLLTTAVICLRQSAAGSPGLGLDVDFDLEYLSGRSEESLRSLQLVQVIHRHGIRNQNQKVLEMSPIFKQVPPFGEYGQLTQLGKLEMFRLGQVLGHRYAGFMERAYKQEQILVLSKDFDRCVQSAQALLLGLFPEVAGAPPGTNNQWNLVPVHSITGIVDNILNQNSFPCPRRDQLVNESLDALEPHFSTTNKNLYKYLSKVVGAPVQSLSDIYLVWNGLTVMRENGFELPVNQSIFDELTRINLQVSDAAQLRIPESQQLFIGPLFEQLMSDIEVRLSGTQKPHMRQYSTSAETLLQLLTLLDIPIYTNVPGSGTLLLELHHENGSDPYVQFFYRNQTDAPPFELNSGTCSKPCTLTVLRSKYSYLLNVTKNFSERCLAKSLE